MAHPIGRRQLVAPSSARFVGQEFVLGSLWFVPVALKLLSADPNSVVVSSSVVAGICALWGLYNPQIVLFSLPYFAVLAPIAGFAELFGGRLLLSDLLFIPLTLQAILLVLSRRKSRLLTLNKWLGALVLIFSISAAFGLLYGDLVSGKPFLYLSQLVIIYFYTKGYARDERVQSRVINAWTVAVILGSIVLIHAFAAGEVLQQFALADETPLYDRENLASLFRATYYYAGFSYLVAITTIVLVVKLVFNGVGKKTVFYWLGVLICCSAMILMVQKTAIVSLILSILCLALVLIKYRYLRQGRVLLQTVVTGALVIAFALPLYADWVDATQYDMLISRFGSSGSFVIRLEVYSTALAEWAAYPVQILTGMGPDFLDNSGLPARASQFKVSAVTGYEEGTVDSGWISYLIELGLAGFLSLLAVYVKGLKRVSQRVARGPRVESGNLAPVCVLAGLLLTTIALFTQMLGYTKTSWLPFQLLMFAYLYRSDKRGQP